MKNDRSSDRGAFEFNTPIDYKTLSHYVDLIQRIHTDTESISIGSSLLGRKIHAIKFGRGKKKVLYVGAHHGMEWLTSAFLIAFVNDFFESLVRSISVGGINLKFLYDNVTFFVIPMLNPDGVEYSLNGTDTENPLYDRVIKMNRGSSDFSRWQANARGVDLNHNYDFGFYEYKKLELDAGIIDGAPTRYSGESPESEPETAAICSLVRSIGFSLAFTLHSQGEEIFYRYNGEGASRARFYSAAKRISKLCGYTLSTPSGMAAYGGFTDWMGERMSIPSFTFECGRGENPLPICDFGKIYGNLRSVFFSAPLMF